ncbi:MAG TPA: hypothetical protein PK685_04445, partial [archaeon]|nr:hypothetical protein [archaeon]
MTIQSDAGELLLYIYNSQIKDSTRPIGTQMIIDETNWEANRINNAFNYLNDNGLIKCNQYLGNVNGVINFWIWRAYPVAIN